MIKYKNLYVLEFFDDKIDNKNNLNSYNLCNNFLNVEVRIITFCTFDKRGEFCLKDKIRVRVSYNYKNYTKYNVNDEVIIRINDDNMLDLSNTKIGGNTLIIGKGIIDKINNDIIDIKPTGVYVHNSSYKYFNEKDINIKDYFTSYNDLYRLFDVNSNDSVNIDRYNKYTNYYDGIFSISYNYWYLTLENYDLNTKKENEFYNSSNKLSAVLASSSFIKKINSLLKKNKISSCNSYIRYKNTEFDMLIVDKNTEDSVIYEDNVVKGIIELKTAGLFFNSKDREVLLNSFIKRYVKYNKNFLYISLHERYYPNDTNRVNYYKEYIDCEKKYTDAYSLFVTLSNSSNKFIIPRKYISILDVVNLIDSF